MQKHTEGSGHPANARPVASRSREGRPWLGSSTGLLASLGALLLVVLYLYQGQDLITWAQASWRSPVGPTPRSRPHDPTLPHIVPIPSSFTSANQTLCLSTDFAIRAPRHAPQDLLGASARTEERVRNTTHTYLSTNGGAEFVNPDKPCETFLSELILVLEADFEGRSIFEDATTELEDRTALETYHLRIPLNGPAVLEANSSLGLFRGLTTFEQLFYASPPQRSKTSLADRHGRRQVNAPFAPYDIHDKPAFPWRGILLDTSRHFFPSEAILRILDTMALVKLNVFQWHITDADSWPLDFATFPELAAHGAYSSLESYDEVTIRQIMQYAGERGIDVVLEIDTPGHTSSIAASHPDKIACFEASPWASHANQPPAGQLRFADPAVANWAAGLFGHVADVSAGRYVGTGGDEVNVNCMMADKPTQEMLQMRGLSLDQALDAFTQTTHSALRERGKTPLVWQEMALDHGPMPSLTNDTIVTVWVKAADALKALDKGYRIVHAAADYLYLDCGQGGWLGKEGGGNSWCDPFKSWQRIYSFDPFAGVADSQRHLVLGGQTSLWAEQTDEQNVESVIWPRAAAAAEVFWAGGPYPRGSVEAFPRMHDIRYRMVDRGIRASPLQPHWCALRPGACDEKA